MLREAQGNSGEQRRFVMSATVGARFMSYRAASAYSGMSESSLRRLVEAGKLTPHKPLGNVVLFDREELDRVILGDSEEVTE
jgi:excisionase family DNA binding protein